MAKYTEHQHLLVRALVLLNEFSAPPLFSPNRVIEMVGPLENGAPVPLGTLKMVMKDARKCREGIIGLDSYFDRVSQAKRYAKGK